MNQFALNAAELLETAVAALSAGGAVADTTIVVGRQGAIRVIDGSGWALNRLGAEYGATAAYRISNGTGGVTVEGRSEGQTCVFRSQPPAVAARVLLGGRCASAAAPESYTATGVALRSARGTTVRLSYPV